MSIEKNPQERLRWYGRRRGHKLRPRRQALVDNLLPRLRLEPAPEGASLDLAGLFPGPVSGIRLEVGFGAGEHLAAQAQIYPDAGFIGCEPFINGVASLLALIEEDGLTNIRIFDDDARELLPCLPEAGIGKVYVLYSDPWPKKRHQRRRFISDATLKMLARTMADGAELLVASDHMDYISGVLELMTRHADLSWQARSKRDWTEPPPDWVETRYEAKAKEQGRKPVYLRFLRNPRDQERDRENTC